MYIRTRRLELKAISDGDRADTIALLNNDEVKKTYMVPDLQSEEQWERLFRRIQELSNSDRFYQAGVFLNGRLIGLVNETGRESDSIELGYAIHPDFHRCGYATEMLAAMIEMLFAEGFGEIIAGAFEENAASLRVMEKCGMQAVGRTERSEYRGREHTCVYRSIRAK